MTRVCFISVTESHSSDAWMPLNLRTRERSIYLLEFISFAVGFKVDFKMG